MHKSKANVFFITSVILFIFITTLNYAYAKDNQIIDNREVIITSDAKEINDTHEIKFHVMNSDVVPEKIAPGIKAIAEIEINLEKIDGFADIIVKIDDSKLNNVFKLNKIVDEKSITSEKITKIKTGRKIKIVLELTWDGNDIEDTKLGSSVDSIEIPIKINVLESI